MSSAQLPVIRALAAADYEQLGALLTALAADSETRKYFRPFPLTSETARHLCQRSARCLDHYYVADVHGRFVAFSMLRGWDEGYAIPSFGAAVHPEFRNAGWGQRVLAHAIRQSRAAGAPQLRLTVYRANTRAVHVYQKMGFHFADKGEQELVGLLDLQSPPVRTMRDAPATRTDLRQHTRAS